MSELRFQKIADQLAKSLISGAITRLGSIRECAVKWQVSYNTMWRAFQELQKKGLIKGSLRRGFEIISKTPESDNLHGWVSAVDKLYTILKKGIIDGIYKQGHQFPKNEFFVKSHQVSHSTVSMAFMKLEKEDLAYKKHRSWIAGKQPDKVLAQSFAFNRSEIPVILFQDVLPELWVDFARNAFTSKLMDPLHHELIPAGFYIKPTARSRHNEISVGSIPIAIPADIAETEEAIGQLGSRYCGCFISSSTPREERLDQWITFFTRYRKPVVFSDITDRGKYITRQYLGLGKQFIRLSLNEDDALRLVVSTLQAYGHTRIGMHGWECFDWSRSRFDRLKSTAKELNDLLIFESLPSESIWNFSNWNGMNEILVSAMNATGSPLHDEDDPLLFNRALGDYLRKNTPSLTNLIIDQKITALIAPNDRFAREYYFWCLAVGIRIPQDLTIISFDNTSESFYFPISTIDFGQARLGYLAAHIFTGNIPVRADRTGTIYATPFLVDRGSLDVPGDAGRVLR